MKHIKLILFLFIATFSLYTVSQDNLESKVKSFMVNHCSLIYYIDKLSIVHSYTGKTNLVTANSSSEYCIKLREI